MVKEEGRSVPEVVGDHVRQLRLAAGLTHEEFAAMLNDLGLGWKRQTVRLAESGRRPITVEELVAIASIFDMSPNEILMGAGSLIPFGRVTIGNRALTNVEWHYLTAPRTAGSPPEDRVLAAIDTLTANIDRPWANLSEEDEEDTPPMRFRKARENAQNRRSTFPGPTFLFEGDGELQRSTPFPPWQESVTVTLRSGEPYVARDELEADVLLEAERDGFVRRITRQQAYRLRKREEP
jgi:transcriptional regulator with XRE-family HTH domain